MQNGMAKKIKQQIERSVIFGSDDMSYDAYMVFVPHGVKLINHSSIYAPDTECHVISSPKNNELVKFAMQGQDLWKKGG